MTKERSCAYCVRSSVHLAMASTVEVQTAEEAKSLSKTESCDWKPVIDLQLPASRNLAVNRNINQFQRLMSGHAWCSNTRHTYTPVWRSTATFILRSSLSRSGYRARIERVLADQRQAEAQL
ncbi:hypothetical protein EMCRGX_G020306 [Ephydatia muelleri]